MSNCVDINVYLSKSGFVYNQKEIVDKLLECFPNARTEWKDLLQIEVQKVLDFVMSKPPEKRPVLMYEQMKRRHDREGPVYQVWLDFDGQQIQGLCGIFSIRFKSLNEMPNEIVAALTDFIKSVTPEHCHDLIECSTLAWRFWDGKKLL